MSSWEDWEERKKRLQKESELHIFMGILAVFLWIGCLALLEIAFGIYRRVRVFIKILIGDYDWRQIY